MSLKETCPHTNTKKNGFRHTLKGPVQRYSCRDCGYKFVLVRQREKMTPEMVQYMNQFEFKATSTRDMARILNGVFNVKISYVTVWWWRNAKPKL